MHDERLSFSMDIKTGRSFELFFDSEKRIFYLRVMDKGVYDKTIKLDPKYLLFADYLQEVLIKKGYFDI